jgi:PAS domain S-box-containing protein
LPGDEKTKDKSAKDDFVRDGGRRHSERELADAGSMDGVMDAARIAELLKQEKYMKLLLESSPEIILLLDRQGRVVYCTEALLRLVNIENFDIVSGWTFQKLYSLFGDEEFLRESVRRFEKVKEGRRTVENDVRIDFSGHGEARMYTVQASPLLDEVGSFDGTLVIYFDTTDVRNTEAIERTRTMSDAMPLSCTFWDLDGNIFDCNQEAVNLFGVGSRREYMDRFYELSPEFQPDGLRSREKARLCIREACEKGRAISEWVHRTVGGETLPAEITFVYTRWKDGHCVIGYARDLREIRSSQREAQEAEERSRALLDATPMACSLWDEKGNLLDCNQEALRMFGVSDESEYLERLYDLSPEFQPNGARSRDEMDVRDQAALETGYQRFEWLHYTSAGEPLPVETTLVRVPWKEMCLLATYSRDLREIKAREQKIHEADERNRELEVRSRAAQVASEAKSRFLASMSHEIRTPINAIIGMSDLMRMDNLDETQRSYFSDIKKMSKALLQIINDILDFSKIEAGKMELSPVHFNLMELYDNICSMSRFMAEAKDLEFRYSFASDVPDVVYGDDARIRQVIVNIVNNAVKYTREGVVELHVGRVRKSDRDYMTFAVRDTGIGIKKENLPRLFDAFAQFDNALNRGIAGTGLGLPITKNLVSLMDGEIEIESEYGRGSVFTVLLPLVEGDPRQVEGASFTAFSVADEDTRVLVVDDNRINLKVAVAYLARHNIRADTASSGAEAIRRVRERRWDLVLMDHMMPEMDGLEATRVIRSLPEGRDIPIVALSANAVAGARELFIEAGMNDFIPKPIDPGALNRVLLEWMPAHMTMKKDSSQDFSDPGATDKTGSVIDEKVGLKNSADDEALYRQLRVNFLEDHASDGERIAEALRAGNRVDARRLAHTLKGTSGLIGAPELREAAFEIEQTLAGSDLDPTADQMCKLDGKLSVVLDELRRTVPKAPDPERAPDSFDEEEAHSLMERLASLLTSGDTRSLELTDEIRRTLSPLGEKCELLLKQMEEFDFYRANETLLSLRESAVEGKYPTEPHGEN